MGYSLTINDHNVLEGYNAESSSIQDPLFNQNRCPESTLGRLISQRLRWVYEMRALETFQPKS
jgi:hypothetical protein